jgi:hypothetical protein
VLQEYQELLDEVVEYLTDERYWVLGMDANADLLPWARALQGPDYVEGECEALPSVGAAGRTPCFLDFVHQIRAHAPHLLQPLWLRPIVIGPQDVAHALMLCSLAPPWRRHTPMP